MSRGGGGAGRERERDGGIGFKAQMERLALRGSKNAASTVPEGKAEGVY